jgi:putative spermidine/putrescine transport system ATP-binding protein
MTTQNLAGGLADRSHALQVRKLTKSYGNQKALDDVSMQVPRGQFVTLLGPSGSGKTTLLMAIAGFVTPSSGTILLNDRDITTLPPERRNFGMVFQGYALFPNMTVEENVWFPLRVRGISREDARVKVRTALDLVQLSHLAGRQPSQLSGGQQQRVALARALVFEPNLLLLDEPLSALDRQLRAELQWELRSLHRRLGVTFINVTHDQEEALSMSDEIVILRNGRIEQVGSPTDLYARPATSFAASFLGDSNFIRGRVTAKQESSFLIDVGQTSVVQAGSPQGAAIDDSIVLAIRPEKLTISAQKPAKANTVQGTISDAKFQGATHHVQVTSADLGILIARISLGKAEGDLNVGSPVWIGWDPGDAVPVREN